MNVMAPQGASVLVEGVTGNQSHLLGTPLTEVTETVDSAAGDVVTTHLFRTAKGSVEVRWRGSVQAQLYPNAK